MNITIQVDSMGMEIESRGNVIDIDGIGLTIPGEIVVEFQKPRGGKFEKIKLLELVRDYLGLI